MINIQSTKDIAAQHLKILVHAPAGAGKTYLCSTTPGKPLIISVEGGLLSLKDFDLDVVTVKTMSELKNVYESLLTDDVHDWVCLDSISEIAEVVLSEEKKKTNDPRKAYGELQDIMMNLMRAFRDLPKNVYMSAKQDKIKDDVSGMIYFSPSAPGQKVSQAMPYLFDEVFVLQTWKDEEGTIQRAFQTCRDERFEAKDRSGKLGFIEPANLTHIYNKIINNESKGEENGSVTTAV